jgi:hypothetical protein
MAPNNAVEIVPIEENTGETRAPKQTKFHQDVEVGSEAIDIDRIERVYA